MRINKVVLKYLASAGVLVLLAASLANLVIKDSTPFKPVKSSVKLDSLANFYSQKLNWRGCYGSFECAMFQVPINYEDVPTGKFDIAVMRHSADNAIGNLVVNPGGPGGSGVDYVYSYQDAFTEEVISKFNLVGFDPRGVGRSAPIKCLTATETDKYYSEDVSPETPDGLAKLEAESADFAKSCSEKNRYLAFYSTANAARDMDILRNLLGDEKLNYLGKSYGTYMGSLYAKLFPDRVGRFVLDGAVDPTLNSVAQSFQQAYGFDSAFKSFSADCQTKSDCVLSGDGLTMVSGKLNELKSNPLTVGDRKLTESLAIYGIAYGLYDPAQGWSLLRKALKDLYDSNGAALMALADSYTGRDSNGRYATNDAESMTVILCDDFPAANIDPATVKDTPTLFGKYVAYGDIDCNYLPHSDFVLIKEPIDLKSSVLVLGLSLIHI